MKRYDQQQFWTPSFFLTTYICSNNYIQKCYIYGTDYWNIVAQDSFEFFWNLIIWTITGKFPPSPSHIIKYYSNPECYSMIAYYPDKRPSSSKQCGKKIDWD
jgi:hypothetical protein